MHFWPLNFSVEMGNAKGEQNRHGNQAYGRQQVVQQLWGKK